MLRDDCRLGHLPTDGASDILPALFAEVVIPEAVRDELLRAHIRLPAWLRVETVKDLGKASRYAQTVDAGEAEAIELARELHADRLLIDERKGRRLATQEGVAVIGLLGVVLLAKRNKLIPSARELLLRLDREAGIYLEATLLETALRSVEE